MDNSFDFNNIEVEDVFSDLDLDKNDPTKSEQIKIDELVKPQKLKTLKVPYIILDNPANAKETEFIVRTEQVLTKSYDKGFTIYLVKESKKFKFSEVDFTVSNIARLVISFPQAKINVGQGEKVYKDSIEVFKDGHSDTNTNNS